MTGEKLNKMYGMSSKCNCGFSLEDRFHILLDCITYHDLRDICISSIISVIQEGHPEILEETICNRTVIAHLLLDATWFQISIGSPEKILPNILTKKETDTIETISRAYCYRIYRRRFDILSSSETETETETTTDTDFSIHDTSTDGDSSKSEWENEHFDN